jgi:mannose-1-phosphate guanylyltransferase
MLLGAGLGTRLRPLTDELPKPLVPIGDRSVLAHVTDRLAAAGIARAVLNTHHLAAAFTPARLAELAVRVEVVHEPVILGTAGGVANAASLLGEGDVLVHNADILAAIDVAGLVAAHAAAGSAATLAVALRSKGQGTVGLDASNGIVRVRAERFADEVSGGDFIGVHVLGAALRAALPRRGCLVEDVYLPALARGARLQAFPHEGPFCDIGTLEVYLEANLTDPSLGSASRHVGAGARVDAGVELRRAIVGAGAHVTGRGLVANAVFWPRAKATAPLERAIVTTSGRVVLVP